MKINIVLFLVLFISISSIAHTKRARDFGIDIGVFKTGKLNAITDVPGVKVGHFTLNKGTDIHTGVTAILPHSENIFQNKVPAAIYIGNGGWKIGRI